MSGREKARGIEHHHPDPGLGRDHLRRDQRRPAKRYRDAHAGEDLGERRLDHHLPDDLLAARTHGICGMDLFHRDGAHPGAGR